MTFVFPAKFDDRTSEVIIGGKDGLDINTGSPYLDIFGAVFIVLAIALGLRLINRRWPQA